MWPGPAGRGPEIGALPVVHRVVGARHIDGNIFPVFFCFQGRHSAAFFVIAQENDEMATKKKASNVKRAHNSKKASKSKRPAKKTKAADDKLTMSEQLKEARKKYTASKSANGSTSAHNGDDVATLLAGSAPDVVCATAEKLAKMKTGELAKKYGHLNPGQVRMCAGNRIRAMVKKEAVTVDEVAKVLAAL
jgi:hypothetical protein